MNNIIARTDGKYTLRLVNQENNEASAIFAATIFEATPGV